MESLSLYKCLGDEQRLRIVNLLKEGPLCVCHLMEILKADQVKVSKQLRMMKELDLVEGERFAQWMIYRLTEPDDALLTANLACLREDRVEGKSLREDLKMREQLTRRIHQETPDYACALAS